MVSPPCTPSVDDVNALLANLGVSNGYGSVRVSAVGDWEWNGSGFSLPIVEEGLPAPAREYAKRARLAPFTNALLCTRDAHGQLSGCVQLAT